MLSSQAHLATEWRADLTFVEREGAHLFEQCAAADACAVDDDSIPSGIFGLADGVDASAAIASAVADPIANLPEALTDSFRAAGLSWTSDIADAPTPFRFENFDLLQRCVTREATIAAIEALRSQTDRRQLASADWLQEKLVEGGWLEKWEAPPRQHLASLFMAELMLAAPSTRKLPADAPGGEATLAITDPAVVVEEGLNQRERICQQWASELAQTPQIHAALLREMLEDELEKEQASD